MLDLNLVQLVVDSTGATIEGKPGAVTPPEGVVSAVDLHEESAVSAAVQPDGSFLLPVASEDRVYFVVVGEASSLAEVRAIAADNPTAMVNIGGATVGQSIPEGPTACMQNREADALLVPAIEQAEEGCVLDDDCEVVIYDHPCARAATMFAAHVDRRAEFEAFLWAVGPAVCPDVQGECSGVAEELGPSGEAKCRDQTCSLYTGPEGCEGQPVWLRWSRFPAGEEPEEYFEYAGLTDFSLTHTLPTGSACVDTLEPCTEEALDTYDKDIRRAVADWHVKSALRQGGREILEGTVEEVIQVDILTEKRSTPVQLTYTPCDERDVSQACGVPLGLWELSEVLRQVELHHGCAE